LNSYWLNVISSDLQVAYIVRKVLFPVLGIIV